MSAHDSLLPGENKLRNIRVDGSGMSMSWKVWKSIFAFLIVVLFGGTGLAGLKFVTCDDLLIAIAKSESKQEEKLIPIRSNISSISNRLELMNQKMDDVQSFQYKQDARQEARRITEIITTREKREYEYDRIREINERRLKQGKDPCSTLECIN